MEIKEALVTGHDMRAFGQAPVPAQDLVDLVDGARLTASSANAQPLQYVVVSQPKLAEGVFESLDWEASPHPGPIPALGARPTAYIVICFRGDYAKFSDPKYEIGSAVQNMLVMAAEKNLARSWQRVLEASPMAQLLGLPEGVSVDSVLALGSCV